MTLVFALVCTVAVFGVYFCFSGYVLLEQNDFNFSLVCFKALSCLNQMTLILVLVCLICTYQNKFKAI